MTDKGGQMTGQAETTFAESTDGVRLAVFEAGNPDGPVVVAVHGYPDNHAVWEGVAAQLGDEYRVVTYDVRGAGASDKPTGRAAYRIDRLGDDLAAVIDAVSPDAPVHLVGHDWGSMQLWEPLSHPRFADRVAGPRRNPQLDHLFRGGLSARYVGLRVARMARSPRGSGAARPI